MNEFIFPLRIYIEDTDYTGIVYHSNYLKFFERARSEWMLGLGLDLAWQREQEIYFVIRSATLEFLKPARMSDQLQVVSRVSCLKRVSVTFEQYLRLSQAPDTVLCTAEVKIACLDNTSRPTSLPQCKLHDIFMGEPA